MGGKKALIARIFQRKVLEFAIWQRERDIKFINNINLMLKDLTGLSGKVKCLKHHKKPLLQVYRLICQSDPS